MRKLVKPVEGGGERETFATRFSEHSIDETKTSMFCVVRFMYLCELLVHAYYVCVVAGIHSQNGDQSTDGEQRFVVGCAFVWRKTLASTMHRVHRFNPLRETIE